MQQRLASLPATPRDADGPPRGGQVEVKSISGARRSDAPPLDDFGIAGVGSATSGPSTSYASPSPGRHPVLANMAEETRRSPPPVDHRPAPQLPRGAPDRDAVRAAPHAAVGDQPYGGVPSTNEAAGAPQMQRFKSGSAATWRRDPQRGPEPVPPRRHLRRAAYPRLFLTRAFAAWDTATCAR